VLSKCYSSFVHAKFRSFRNIQLATRISVCVIAVSKSHEFLVKVRRLSSFFSTTTPTPSRRRVVIFFHDDARDSTSTTSRCFFNDVGHYWSPRPLWERHVKAEPFSVGSLNQGMNIKVLYPQTNVSSTHHPSYTTEVNPRRLWPWLCTECYFSNFPWSTMYIDHYFITPNLNSGSSFGLKFLNPLIPHPTKWPCGYMEVPDGLHCEIFRTMSTAATLKSVLSCSIAVIIALSDNDSEKQQKRCTNIVSYEFLWIRKTCDYI